MGLSNRVQTIFVFVSVFLIMMGTAVATIPTDLPQEWKISIELVLWSMGITGLALKEALGIDNSQSSASSSQTKT